MTRQESLFAILRRAAEAAKECGETVYVIRCQVYVDEFAEGEHVYGTKGACACLFPRFEQFGGEIEASVEKDGSVFFTKVEDVLNSIKLHKGKFIRIDFGAPAEQGATIKGTVGEGRQA